MRRQTVIWLIIGAIFVALIAVRAGLDRMGRVYVEPVSVAFRVTPPERAPWADPDSRMPPPTATAIDPPADAKERRGVWREDDGAVIGWTTWRDISATRVWQARADAAASGAPAPPYELSWARTIGLWLAALLTLAILSFLYRDNPFYKVTESIVVGASAAYYMVVGFWDTLVPKLFGRIATEQVREWVQPSIIDPEFADRIAMWAAALLGVMLLMQLVPKVRWMSVWPLAFVVGTFAGLKLYTYIESDLLAQLRAATEASPVVVVTTDPQGQPLGAGGAVWQSFLVSLKNTLLLGGTLCTLVYFFFSMEHKGAVGKVARVGIWFLMITFGAAFGFTVMGRVTLLAKRFEFLFDDWLWFIDPKNLHAVPETAAKAVTMWIGGGA